MIESGLLTSYLPTESTIKNIAFRDLCNDVKKRHTSKKCSNNNNNNNV